MRKALGYAAIWGLAYHGTALSWIVGWLDALRAMGVPWLGSVAIALLAWAFITIWGAAIGMTWMALMVAIGRRQPMTGAVRVLVGTALWCAVEWVWSKGPLYWTSLSYTQSPFNLLSLQLGQLSGPITVTAGIVAVNGLLAEGLGSGKRKEGERRPFGGTKGWFRVQATAKLIRWGIALFLGLHLLGLGLYSRSLADRPDQALAVGLVQGNIPTSEKIVARGVQKSRQVYLKGYKTLVNEGAQLVVTPEGAIPEEWSSFLQARNPVCASGGGSGGAAGARNFCT